jgi:hypothetical protein
MSAHHTKTPQLVLANARHGPGHGCALRPGPEALDLTRRKRSSGLLVSGLGPDQAPMGVLLSHDKKTLRL